MTKDETQDILTYIERRDIDSIERWLERGGDPNLITGEKNAGLPLIYHVLWEIDEPEDDEVILQMLSLLIHYGCNVNTTFKDLPLPLMEAVKEEKAAIAKILLEAGANSHIRDEESSTPIRYATAVNDMETLKVLLPYSNEELINQYGGFAGDTPLGAAFWNLNIDAIELLLQHGADPYAVDLDGRETIHSIPKDTPQKVQREIANLIEKYTK